tara:strand:- start:3831 stop:5066 length:1236 start_codon:yes stop_codon:yes gene_type:complete
LSTVCVVVDPKANSLRDAIGHRAIVIPQDSDGYGTGHALKSASPYYENLDGTLVVLYADTPLIRPETINSLVAARESTNAVISCLTAKAEDPGGYGRIIRDSSGTITSIREASSCTNDELRISEFNTGVMAFDSCWLRNAITKLKLDIEHNETLLTDIVSIAISSGEIVTSTLLVDSTEGLGCNTRAELAIAEKYLWQRKALELMATGVRIQHPDTTYIDQDVVVGEDSNILAGTHLEGKTIVGRGSLIGPRTTLSNSTVEDGCEIRESTVEDSVVKSACTIGPYSHLRPGTVLADNVHVGNYAEVKNSYVGEGTQIGHFSYIGDAKLGNQVNIGAGVVTCNFDGKNKNQTRIGDDSFVGSGSMLVAPVTIGTKCVVGAGSVVTRSIPDGIKAYGNPAKAQPKPGEILGNE